MASPIYPEKNQPTNEDLIKRLQVAVEDLRLEMQTTIPIRKAHCTIGFGVDKLRRNMAADTVISIARAIRSIKAW